MGQLIQQFDFEGRRGARTLPSVLFDAFSPHSFTSQSSLDKPASFSHAPLGKGSLSLFSMPTESEVSCDVTDSYFLVFIKGGEATYEIENERFQVRAGQGVIINRGVKFSRKSGAAGTDLAIVRLSPVQVQRHLPIEAADKPHGDFRFPTRFDVSSPPGAALWRCVQYVQNELVSLDAGLDVLDDHVENLENFLVRTVMDTVGRTTSLPGLAGNRNVLPGYLKKIISHMLAHCHEPIQLKDLCRIGNVSERTISAGFRRYMNVSPIQYLKQSRLGHVHEELQRASVGTTVTDVAMYWGFRQLGWFSAEYRKQFGETPSETLRWARLL